MRSAPSGCGGRKRAVSGIFRGVGRDALLSFGGAGKGNRAAVFGAGDPEIRRPGADGQRTEPECGLSRISGRRPMKKAGRLRFAICGSKKRLPRRGEPPGRLFLWISCRFAVEGRKKEVSLGGKKGRFRERKGTLREKERFSAAFKNCF